MNVTPEGVSRSLDVMGIFLESTVKSMVEVNVRNLVAVSSEKVLTVGFLGAVWAASSAVSATIKALNRANDVPETRSFLYRRSLSVGLMAGLGLAMTISFNLLILGSWIEDELLVRLGLQQVIHPVIVYLKYPVGILSTVFMVSLLYRIAPNCRPQFRSVLPGAILFAELWFLLSKAFGYYVGNFSYYNRVLGLLGAFLAMQLWIYFSALILLIGGELNAELEQRRTPLPPPA
jgi:membrane protein